MQIQCNIEQKFQHCVAAGVSGGVGAPADTSRSTTSPPAPAGFAAGASGAPTGTSAAEPRAGGGKMPKHTLQSGRAKMARQEAKRASQESKKSQGEVRSQKSRKTEAKQQPQITSGKIPGTFHCSSNWHMG